MAQAKQSPKPTRQPDIFTEARRIYNARKRLLTKADQLMADASDQVRACVESIEESEAAAIVDAVPRSAGDLPTDD
jgi:hypothetical protein